MSYAQDKRKKRLQLQSNREKRNEVIKELIPLAKSFTLWIILVVIVATDYTNSRWFSMQFVEFTTFTSLLLSKALGLSVEILGNGVSTITTLNVNYTTISINKFPMIIELECSAYHAYLAMLALVIFSKWKIKAKLLIGSIIFVILTIVNALRIAVLGIIGANNPNIFNAMHDYIWNILLVIVIWGIWEITDRKLGNQNHEKPA